MNENLDDSEDIKAVAITSIPCQGIQFADGHRTTALSPEETVHALITLYESGWREVSCVFIDYDSRDIPTCMSLNEKRHGKQKLTTEQCPQCIHASCEEGEEIREENEV